MEKNFRILVVEYLNMINHSEDNDFLVFNPDTLWNEIILMKLIKCRNFIFQKN